MAKDQINAALSLDGLGDDARAAFDVASGAHYAGIVIPTNHPQFSTAELSGTGKRQIRKILETKNLKLEALRVAAPRGGLSTSHSVDRTVDNAQKAIALAYELGVTHIAVNAGGLEDAAMAQAAAERIAAEADRANITVAFSADSADKLATLLKSLNYDRARANLESARAIAANVDPNEAAQQLAGLISQLTAADAIRAGGSIRNVELGQGQLALADLLATLRDLNFNGPVIVDVRNLPNAALAAEHAAAILRPLLSLPRGGRS